ncbi:feruloyl esterase [Mannheimia haemolytica]|uniref:Feruloyl esterase n=1 Tax=Mannheimia haemolytica TaxID=75985 RepID=A0A547ENU5_MANHA|nr:feruloyl esterase [Mannheimia haemolytica USDA-ARS-USMARC-183]AGI34467.1 feruloyl esterase [Mannheimia haemolytica USDA-ARS-USMARC-185]ASW16793.1 feruloyl esterase [Mannheimia haemolytica USDA-ARS-USMARC-184]ASW37290.1 feruloyl esterase [Mannheimia haemolytica]AWW72317.1 feruloyl esterase [Pasteurellaceae bacterium 12565]
MFSHRISQSSVRKNGEKNKKKSDYFHHLHQYKRLFFRKFLQILN